MTDVALARRRFRFLVMALVLGCTAAAGPYVAKPGTEPTTPVEEARQRCEKQAGFRTMDGSRQMDWGEFRRCMGDLGWIPDPSDGAP